MKSLLTIPIKASDPARVEALLRSSPPQIDAYEIWLDAMPRSHQTFPLVEETCHHWRSLTKKKLIFVCKDPKEQGNFMATDDVRVEVLLRASIAGADYVDVPLNTNKKEVLRLRKALKKTKLIISYHDFEKTPSPATLRSTAKKMMALKADVLKIATTVKTLEDNQLLTDLALELKKGKIRHIVIGMGALGLTTRVFADTLGNELNFVSLDSATAPGQLSLKKALGFSFLAS